MYLYTKLMTMKFILFVLSLSFIIVSCKKDNNSVNIGTKELSEGIKIVENINTGSDDTLLWKFNIKLGNINDDIYTKLSVNESGQIVLHTILYYFKDSLMTFNFYDDKLNSIVVASTKNNDSINYINYSSFIENGNNMVGVSLFKKNKIDNKLRLIDAFSVKDSLGIYVSNRINSDAQCSPLERTLDYWQDTKKLTKLQIAGGLTVCVLAPPLCLDAIVVNLVDVAIGAILGKCNEVSEDNNTEESLPEKLKEYIPEYTEDEEVKAANEEIKEDIEEYSEPKSINTVGVNTYAGANRTQIVKLNSNCYKENGVDENGETIYLWGIGTVDLSVTLVSATHKIVQSIVGDLVSQYHIGQCMVIYSLSNYIPLQGYTSLPYPNNFANDGSTKYTPGTYQYSSNAKCIYSTSAPSIYCPELVDLGGYSSDLYLEVSRSFEGNFYPKFYSNYNAIVMYIEHGSAGRTLYWGYY
jgi:hypothetical protein